MKYHLKLFVIIPFALAVYIIISASQYNITNNKDIIVLDNKIDSTFQKIDNVSQDLLLNGYIRYDYQNGNIKDEGFYLNNIKHGWWRGFTESGIVLYFGQFDQNLKTKYWKYFYENGNICEEGIYNQGNKEGWWKKYNDSGDLIAMGTYINDLKEGLWQYFYSNGNLKAEGEFYRNKKVDWWKEYNEKGELESEGHYVLGLRNGFWIHYLYEKKECEGLYVDGARTGTWKYFDESEQLAQIYDY